jgi:hypothetical protein
MGSRIHRETRPQCSVGIVECPARMAVQIAFLFRKEIRDDRMKISGSNS